MANRSDLDNQLSFVLDNASRALRRGFRRPLAEIGLTYPQYTVLQLLWERGEHRLTDVAASLQLDMPTCSPLIKRMEQAGLVDCRFDPNDHRAIRISPSTTSRQLQAKCDQIRDDVMAACPLVSREVDRLVAQLRVLTDAYLRSPEGAQPDQGD